jgi:hypothetical protein
MGGDEFNMLRPIRGCDLTVECKECLGKLNKRSVPTHMMKQHDLNDGCKQWIASKDGYNRRCFQRFKPAYTKYKLDNNETDSDEAVEEEDEDDDDEAVEEDDYDEEDGEEETDPSARDCPVVPASLPQANTPFVAENRALMEQFRNMMGPKNIIEEGIKPPVVKFEQWAADWKPTWEKKPPTAKIPKDIKDKFDVRDSKKVDLSDFEQWLKSKGYTDSVIYKDMIAIRRLVNTMLIPDNTPVIDLLVACYQQDVIEMLYMMPLYNMEFTWSKNGIKSMMKLADFAMSACSKRTNPAKNTRDALQLFYDESLNPLDIKANNQSHAQKSIKKRIDTARLKYMPAECIVKAAVFQAMLDLQFICSGVILENWDSQYYLAAAGAIMVGILYFNGFGGRSKEWRIFRKDDIRRQLEEHPNRVVCTDHKTSKVYGDLAKWIAPGTLAAILAYLGMQFHTSDFFLSAIRDTTNFASVAYFLKKFCMIYFPFYPIINVNLIRKHFHTALIRRQNRKDMWKLLKKADAHSEHMAETVYTCLNEEDDSEFGELLFRSVWGDPVEWPRGYMMRETEIADQGKRCALHYCTTLDFNNIDPDNWFSLDMESNEVLPIEDDAIDEEINAQIDASETHQYAAPTEEDINLLQLVPYGDGVDPIPEEEPAENASGAPLPLPAPAIQKPTKAAKDDRWSCTHLSQDNVDKLFRGSSTSSNSTNQRGSSKDCEKNDQKQKREKKSKPFDDPDIHKFALEQAEIHNCGDKPPCSATRRLIYQHGKHTKIFTARHTDEGLRQLYRRIMPGGDFNPTQLVKMGTEDSEDCDEKEHFGDLNVWIGCQSALTVIVNRMSKCLTNHAW